MLKLIFAAIVALPPTEPHEAIELGSDARANDDVHLFSWMAVVVVIVPRVFSIGTYDFSVFERLPNPLYS